MENTDKSAEEFHERLIYCQDFGGGYIGHFVNMTNVIVTADSVEELKRKAKVMGAMMITMLTMGLENIELKEITLAEYMKDPDAYMKGCKVGREAAEKKSAQQLSEYKEVIKELLPLAALSKITVDNPNWRELWENKTKVIDRAKALLQGSNQGQPQQESEQP